MSFSQQLGSLNSLENRKKDNENETSATLNGTNKQGNK
jgi:hypothetical protein